MNDLKVFKNSDFGELGILLEEGNYLFPATDCATMLGYSNPRDAIKRHCWGEGVVKRDVVSKSTNQHGTTTEQTVEKTFIDEGNLYALISNSKLEGAYRFRHWVCYEVLPSIRKHGMYATPQTMQEMISNPDFAIQLLTKLKDEQAQNAKLTEKIEADKPKVEFAEAVESSKDSILVGGMAKLIRQNGVSMGERRLFQWLRDKGYLMQFGTERNIPTQYSMDHGLLEIKERAIYIEGKPALRRTPMVTGKGQIYFLNKFKKGNVAV